MTASVPDDAAYWISLHLIPGLGPANFCRLLQAFGSPEGIFSASYSQLRSHVDTNLAQAITQGLNNSAIAPTLEWLKQPGNYMLTLADTAYPQSLLQISDPPPVLYAKGNLQLLNQPSLAVVGSRNASPQGEKNAEDFCEALCQHGLCIVSGMALGIDGAAHRGALRANGATIAVVGTGLDIVYPSRHRELAHQIVNRGLILSEFPLGTPSKPQNFPRRNRIISGLSLGCLVVEANLQSGSLITARLAAEQGREVFAIPGSIHSPVSKGCHELIKQGAKLVDNIYDILIELKASTTHQVSNQNASEEKNPVLEIMGFDPINMETLISRSGLTSEVLSAMLLVLELESKIASLPGGRYQRIV